MNKKTVAGIAAGRKLHLVDVENLCGSGLLTVELVRAARAMYLSQAFVGVDDVIVVGAGALNKQVLAFGWPGARMVVRSGPDGADLALCEEIECSRYCETYSEVVVGSGDHIFAEPIGVLTGKGLKVTVFAQAKSLASVLRGVGAQVVLAEAFGLAA